MVMDSAGKSNNTLGHEGQGAAAPQSRPDAAPARKRRWRQYSLRVLLLTMLLVSLPLAWFGYHYNQFRLEAAAIEHFSKLGAKIKTTPAQPEWFWGRLPKQLRTICVRIDELDVHNNHYVSDDDLAHLRGIRVRTLDLSNGRLSDAGLVHVAGLGSVEDLRLGSAKFTNGGISQLPIFKGLRRLHVGYTKVDDEIAPWIARFTELERLSLNGTRVTAKSLPILGTLPNLTHTSLPRACFDASAIHHVLKPDRPHELIGAGHDFGNSVLGELAKFPSLDRLQVTLASTGITMTGIRTDLLALPKGISVTFRTAAEINREEFQRFVQEHPDLNLRLENPAGYGTMEPSPDARNVKGTPTPAKFRVEKSR